MQEYVVLVDDNDREIGRALKEEVHSKETLLHRAFSVFLFNDKNEVLVQQRALSKKTWPGIWSNSCCGHPASGESYEAAIRRRVKEELGCGIQDLEKVSDYRYRFERDGIVENEICPVYRAAIEENIRANPAEINSYRWVAWERWLAELAADQTNQWSEWCKEEVKLFPA